MKKINGVHLSTYLCFRKRALALVPFRLNKLVFLLLTVFASAIFLQAQQNREIISYQSDKNNVVFHFNDQSALSIKFLDSKNLKFWFSPDASFQRSNPSFAVVHEEFQPDYKISASESPSLYEIFTGDLRIIAYKSPFRIEIYNKYQRLVLGDSENGAYTVDKKTVSTRKILREDEHFLGLGEKAGALDRRGKSYTMWNSDKPCYSETEDPLYKSIPFFMSNYNYGIFFDNTYKTQFDFGKSNEKEFSFSSPGGAFIYYFFYGKDYSEIIGNYTKLTGNPIMPPKWALGWSQSRGLLTNETLTREIASEYRKRQIPIDIIYQDIGWVEGLQNFEWKKGNYQNPKQMLADLGQMGIKVIVSQDPVVSQSTIAQWSEADEKGYFAKDSRNGKSYDMPWPWGGNAGVVDFTNPEVAGWWGELQQKPVNDGVKGFWTDMGEPAWSNEEAQDRLFMKHYSGMHDEIHNVYGFTWDKVVTEEFEKRNPNQRIFQMTRSAYAGLQRYTFGWSGDSGNGEDVNDGWKNLANQIPVGLSAGMGLIPFWTTDISGYCGDITDYDEFSELYIRWLQFGIFNPLSRAHHEGNNAVEPWLFGEEAETIARSSVEFKYKLIPYIYTYARVAYDTGMPILRAIPLEFPKDIKAISVNDQFMFGKEIMVAPVVEKAVRSRRIYFPEGTWVDYHNPSSKYEGGTTSDYPVNLKTIPVFVKEGSIIPKMPVMQFVGELKNAPVIFEIFPSGEKKSSFELYEDDGETNDYKKNIYAKTLISSESENNSILVHLEKPVQNGFRTEKRNYFFEVHMAQSPKNVLLNGVKLKNSGKLTQNNNTDFEAKGFHYDKDRQVVTIRIPDPKSEATIQISF